MRLHIEPDEFTLGDLEDFEEFTGGIDLLSAMEPKIVRDDQGHAVEDPNDPDGGPLKETQISTKVLVGLIYLVARKENPNITREEVRAMKVTEVEIDWGGDEDQDPTTEGDENAA